MDIGLENQSQDIQPWGVLVVQIALEKIAEDGNIALHAAQRWTAKGEMTMREHIGTIFDEGGRE